MRMIVNNPKTGQDRWSKPALLIDGTFVEGAGTQLDVQNPATEQVIAHVRTADLAQVDQAARGPGCL
jgi:hypothetical protein